MIPSEESLRRAINSMMIMPTCRACIMIVTKDYINSYYAGDPEIVTQVKLSKQLKQPVILMVENDLTPNEKFQVKNMFQGHRVVAKITYDPKNFQRSTPELLKALKPYEA